MSFSQEFRESAVKRVLSGGSVQDIAGEFGVSKFTLYQWVREQQPGGKPSRVPSGLALQDKQALLLESRALLDADLGEWLRKKGLHSEHLEKWEKEISQAMAKNSEEQLRIKALEKEIEDLKKDLNRKDKALAEVTAILALKKKLSHLFPDEEK